MHRLFTVAAICSTATSMAAAQPPVPLQGKKIPAIALLPPGSELKGVMLPRYDENRKLVGVLKSKTMTLVNAGRIAGKAISIRFYNPDQTTRGSIDLASASFDQEKGLLESKAAVAIDFNRLSARGTGLHYAFGTGRGFLSGPATTTIQAPTETAMKFPPASLLATAMLGTSLLAAPPPAVTAEEMAALEADTASTAGQATAMDAATAANLKQDLADAADASADAATFLAQADLPKVPADAIPAPDAPLAIKPDIGDTVIRSDGGMYFDADEGVLVYLKNVTVKDPRFDLSGANELKVFLEKKPAKEGDKEKPDGDIAAGFGAVERIIATGAVKIDQKPAEGKDPIQASGAIFSYNIKKDEIIISGGYPWVMMGKQAFRATKPDLVLRINPKTGEARTEGPWDTILNLQKKN